MNSPMREVRHGRTPGGRLTEPGPAAAYATDGPAQGLAEEPLPAAGSTGAGTEGLVHASGVMAAGTLVSRVTGFVRTAVIAIALGTGFVADAYNNANTFPNAVFDLLLGGILTSVFVPLLVDAAKRHADGGRAYDQRMFTAAAANPMNAGVLLSCMA